MPHTKEYHRNWKRNKMEALRADPVAWAEHQAKKAEYDKEYRQANRVRRKELALEWSRKPETKQKQHARYMDKYWADRTRKDRPTYDRKAKQREYFEKNREKVRAIQRIWEDNNREKIRQYAREAWQRNKQKWVPIRNARRKALFIEKPHLKIVHNLRDRVRDVVRGLASTSECMRMVGCSPEELKTHLQVQFHDGMTWQNYGRNGWHADHVRPISHFNLELESERAACFHYTNLQPMWGSENCSKGNRKIYRVMGRALTA